MARVTLKTVAERVGVSSMTVSNAFSRPDQLSAALREKILAAAAELGYAGPDPAARTLARGATGTVGILLTESLHYAFTDEFSAVFLTAIAEELATGGLALTLLPPEGAADVIPARDVAMDGAIVYSCRPGTDGLEHLLRRRLPLVHVDQPHDDESISVNVDDLGGARAVARHVIDLGHERVALLVPRDDEGPDRAPALVSGGAAPALRRYQGPAPGARSNTRGQRERGWRAELEPAGVDIVVVECAASTTEEGDAAILPLLSGPDRPTAVLCFSDALAVGALRAAREAGLTVPADLSVAGFDDSPLAQHVEPPLTTVRQDASAKGRLAAAALVEAIARRRTGAEPEVSHIVLPTELVIRQSTARPPVAKPPAGT